MCYKAGSERPNGSDWKNISKGSDAEHKICNDDEVIMMVMMMMMVMMIMTIEARLIINKYQL